MAHIALDVRFINSGTGTYAVKLIDYLQKLDTENDYSLIVLEKDKDYYHPTNPRFTARTVPYAAYTFSEQIGFLNYLNDLKPDLVHFCMPQQPVLYGGRKVTTIHDLTQIHTYNSDKNWLVYYAKQLVARCVFRHIAQTSSRVIAISNHTKQDFQANTRATDEKIAVIYEAGEAHPSELKPYEGLPFSRFVMYVGQQPDYKNIRRLGEAHQLLLESDPDLGLILVGRLNKGALRNKDYFERNGFKNIHFTDFIPDSKRDWLFTKAVAYVFPSLMEGFGLPPLEAMAYGLPVISSNASCMPEVLGDAAVYFEPKDTADMARVIGETIHSPARLNSMREKGYEQVKKYSWEKMAKETLEVYRDALKR